MRLNRTSCLAPIPLLLTLALTASCASAPDPSTAAAQPLSAHPHRFCGWLFEHPDDADTQLAYDTFAAHASELDAVHPKWWRVGSPTTFVNHPPERDAPYRGFHDRRVLDHTTASGGSTRLIPMIAATMPADLVFVHAMIHDPALRAEHAAALARLAVDNGYDGVDLDYEHLRRARLHISPLKSAEEERAALTAFVQAAAAELHARGKELSMAIPANFSASSEFDLEAISAATDELHVMGYDLHYEGGDHAGPGAPMGWIQQFIDHVATIDGGRRAPRFILGLSNSGVFGAPGSGIAEGCEPLTRCFAMFQGDYATTTDEMEHCPEETGIDPGRAPNVLLPDGKRLFFEDLLSLEEKVTAAQAGGFGGITYWGMGGEAARPGSRTFFEMVRSHFPRSDVQLP